ncbi:type I secretion system permease/ATPase [Ferrovibrio sp.]|uniref:type I secretion system permease/ATPase n=1 Tax=Ferrovibrio sp. TaxID=1917215 RepID=UPI0025BADA76|nr:type I secretion system permease/ATPase [Ferrovibrio sp.]MBX3454259.1 type I secretion system permease/ATPase [Ferrovibrio sp.]
MSDSINPLPNIDSGLFSLAALLRLFGQPMDPEQLQHRFGRPGQMLGAAEIVRAGRELGLKARLIESNWQKLAGTQLPAIAECRDGRFVLLAARRAEADKEAVLVLDQGNGRPVSLSRTEFEGSWTGRLILLASRASLAGDQRRFDFTWFIPALVKYRGLLGEVLFGSFLIQLLALAAPFVFQIVIDKVLVHRSLTTLDVLVFAFLVISVFETIFGGLRAYLLAHTTNRIDVELGARLFDRLLSLPLAYFGARRVGDTVARMRELETIRNFLTSSALSVAVDVAFTIVFIAVMLAYSGFLSMIVLLSLPVYVLLSFIVTPMLRRRLEESFVRGAESQSFLVERVSGVETLKAMAVEPQTQRRWEELLAGYVGASFRANFLGNVAGQLAQMVNKIVVAATLWFGAKLVIEGAITVGELVAFNMLASRVSTPILRLAQIWQDFQRARISVDRLGDIMNVPGEAGLRTGRASLPILRGEIGFDRVTFRYTADGPDVLRQIGLHVPAGQVLGIVGPSGSGKSTLTKLVQRLYAPQGGRVLLDGMDIAGVDVIGLRRQIGVVLQENVLFSGSVRENIALANPGLALDQVIHVAKLAGAHDFIMAMPQGYDTLVGERGFNISGGQRQRLAIARALAIDPRILIFDEATSALDVESELAIQRNMSQIRQGRTVLIVAHRLSAVRSADRVVLLDQGVIVEDGKPEELLHKGGRFAAMYRLQAGGIHAV